jgi:hypothetical protein
MLVEKDLSKRVNNCLFCSLIYCRDLNAATNILSLGLQFVRKIEKYPSSFYEVSSHFIQFLLLVNQDIPKPTNNLYMKKRKTPESLAQGI